MYICLRDFYVVVVDLPHPSYGTVSLPPKPWRFKVKYTKVQIPTDLALALRYTAASRRVGRQAFIQSVLAQVVLAVTPEVSGWEGVQSAAYIPNVPTLTIKEKDAPPAQSRPISHEEASEYVESRPRPVKIPAAALAWMATVVKKDYDAHYADVIRENQHRDLKNDEIKLLALERMRDE